MLIDSHVHISTMLGFTMTKEMVLEMMGKYHIDYVLLSNCDAAEYDHQLNMIPKEYQKTQADSFQESIDFARKHPGTIGVLPWIKPTTETADQRFEEMIKNNLDVVKGIKHHAYHCKTATDADSMVPYIEIAKKYQLPVMIHTGGCEEASPQSVYRMAKRYPEVLFIMAHMGLGTDNREAIDLMGKAENLIADTAWVPVESTLEIIRRYGSKRVLFGTDSPIDGVDTYWYNGSGEPSMYRAYFEGLKEQIGENAYEDLMYRNAIRIFRLEDLFTM